MVVAVVAAVMVGLGFLLDLPPTGWDGWTTAAATALACLLYMAVHELTHGAFLWMLSGVRPTVALRVPYLVTGSRAYLDRRAFVVVALAPVVLWGAVLMVLLLTVAPQFLLTVYVVTALNFASSAGDYYQACVVARLPRSVVIQDDGTTTRVFLPAA
ncbi:DUF3267 domain-containing protein [Pseudonocardia hydrocarbonoxydans]|uniref:DUF3267 domain-containing protein n=1 Tax=Pseudonocardia hydrocarbonoxydans TaxID=76726 RepID=UPI0031DA61F6